MPHRPSFIGSFEIVFKSHSGCLPKLTASAANALAFLQTAQSELIRRSASLRYSALSRRITPD
jgi:hypothetical protein